jgi:hypothetical protein
VLLFGGGIVELVELLAKVLRRKIGETRLAKGKARRQDALVV